MDSIERKRNEEFLDRFVDMLFSIDIDELSDECLIGIKPHILTIVKKLNDDITKHIAKRVED